MHRHIVTGTMLLCFAVFAPACTASGDVEEMTGADESALDFGLSPATLAESNAADPVAVADAMVAKSDGEGCKTRVKDAENPNVVHVFLDNCTGRFGRHVKSGEILVTFSANDNGTLHTEHQSVWLTIDGQPATRSASADISFDGDIRHVVWHGEKTSMKDDGEEVTRIADHVIDIHRQTKCSVINGTAEITKSDKVVHAQLIDLTSCEAPEGGHFCPTGRIEASVEGRDVQITKSFDGSETATIEITKPAGEKTREVLLDCIAR